MARIADQGAGGVGRCRYFYSRVPSFASSAGVSRMSAGTAATSRVVAVGRGGSAGGPLPTAASAASWPLGLRGEICGGLRPTNSARVGGRGLHGCWRRQRRRLLQRGRTTRRLFDSGSFFGIGAGEALVVALLGWFVLGPQELYKLAKTIGGWLGEARQFVGQAARQYESTLDQESTRAAISGIRETQKTLYEVGSSWRSVADSLRDPLALSSTLESSFEKYADKKETADTEKGDTDTKPNVKREKATDNQRNEKLGKNGKAEGEASQGYPDLDSSDADDEDQKLEELRAMSRESAKDLWFSGSKADTMADIPPEEELLQRLDRKLSMVDTMTSQLDELREGILMDRDEIRDVLDDLEESRTSAVASTPSGTK